MDAIKKGIDCDETFAPTCCMASIHSLCALIAHYDWSIHHLDIEFAFLNGDLHEEVYV